MSRDGLDKYEKGGFYRISDRSGQRYRARDTVEEWNGAIVGRDEAEPRHPQEFLRSKRDDQSVPKPRPQETVHDYSGPLVTNLTADAAAGATTIAVDASTDFAIGDKVSVTLDSNDVNLNAVSSVPDSTHLVLVTALPFAASTGARVVNYDAVSTPTL